MTDTRLRVLMMALCAIACAGRVLRAEPAELHAGDPNTIAIAPGGLLEVKAISGEVIMTEASGNDVTITVVKAPAATDVRVVALTHDDGVTVCVVYPSTDPKKPTECLPGNKGRLSPGNPKDALPVRLKIQVPAGVRVKAGIGYGDIRSKVAGDLSLYSNRGNLTIYDAGAGAIDAAVGLLGNIDCLIASTSSAQTRPIKLEAAGNGKVRVFLPTSVGVSYFISTQSTPLVDPVFQMEKRGPPFNGHLGSASTDVRLSVDTGIAGTFELRRPPATPSSR